MATISSTWLNMIQKYYKAANAHIDEIRSRTNKDIPAPNRGDEKDDKLMVEEKPSGELVYSGEIKLRDILTRLQYLTHFNKRRTETQPRLTISMNILGKVTKFKLKESEVDRNSEKVRGRQILIYKGDDEMPKYEAIMACLNTMDSGELARSILKALDTSLNAQQKHELVNCSDDGIDNVRMFILLTHIAEAAVPSKAALDSYLEHAKKSKKHFSGFLVKDCIRHLPKHGRIPMMDKIVRAKLRKIVNPPTFETEFSFKEFPIQKTGGTESARERALEGNEIDNLSDIGDVDDGLSTDFGAMSVSENTV